MKKLAFSLLAMVFAFNLSHAQWLQQSGTGNYNLNSGYAGIGTNNPTLGSLQIDGTNADLLSLNGINTSNAVQFNAYNNYDFRIVQRSSSPLTLWTNTVERMRITADGNIGIGVANPTQRLDVNGSLHTSGQVISSYGMFSLPGIIVGDSQYGMYVDAGSLYFKSASNGTYFWRNYNNSSNVMSVDANGNLNSAGTGFFNTGIVIGTSAMPNGYSLAVNGSMIATSIKVKSYANWPDYVFKSTYNLRPLSEVKVYIDQNQHLPEVPSATTVEKEGMDVGEMNKILLKKVEELTLYLIEKDQKDKDLKQQVDALTKEVFLLKANGHQ